MMFVLRIGGGMKIGLKEVCSCCRFCGTRALSNHCQRSHINCAMVRRAHGADLDVGCNLDKLAQELL
jgi:hypothetical protein